jgi:hypothetical protein
MGLLVHCSPNSPSVNSKQPDRLKKFSRLIAEVDGKFVRWDGFPADPLNTSRQVNTSKLCKDMLEAKDFNFYPEDLPATLKAFPAARLFRYNFTLIIDDKQPHILS